jgi:alpha-amylase
MVEMGQIELLSGGFYEPILPILPDEDKVGQIRKLNGYLLDRFGVNPQGMWCAERVWEPHLPKPIRKAGIHYTVLDDTHFISAGLSEKDLGGYYRVEEQNESIDIFPISKELRYAMPFSSPEKAVEILAGRAAGDSSQCAIVMADDGEKFGMWPGTHKLVYQERWLEKFLDLLEKNSEWIATRTFSEYRREFPALGIIYLPAASYFEMSEWALPAESQTEFEDILQDIDRQPRPARVKKFMRGGIWRNFLAKYPEANSMYRKMLRVSQKVHRAAEALVRPSSLKLSQEALDRLWAGQCNCAFWHGVFGGIYLPVLRQAIYKNLIEAEKLVDLFNSKRGSKTPSPLEIADYDGDGKKEFLIETPLENLYIAPEQGGAILEWDFKPASVNVLNVLTRRPEAYHKKLKSSKTPEEKNQDPSAKSIHDVTLVKEKGIENLISYDWYRRSSLLDHFLHPATDEESFRRCSYGEQGDFVLGQYEIGALDRSDAKPDRFPTLKLSRNGMVWAGEKKRNLTVEKVLRLKVTDGAPNRAARGRAQKTSNPEAQKSNLQVSYRITNSQGDGLADLWFATEFNFSFSVPEKEKDRSFTGAGRWQRQDRHLFWKATVDFSHPTDGWVFPLETISNSESGFEKTFQGIVFLPHWKFSLGPGESFERVLNLTIEKIKNQGDT